MRETLRATWDALLGADVTWAGIALLLYAASLVVAGARWRVIVRALGGRLALRHSTMAIAAGVFVNNITPTGRLGGEACRIAITRMRGELSLTRGALASICDRLADLPGVLLVALVSLPVLSPLARGHAAGVVLSLAVAGVVLYLFIRWLRRMLRASIATWRADPGAPGLNVFTVVSGLGYGVLIWVEDVLRVLAVALAFGVHLSLPQASALCIIGLLGGFVPTIGGLGAVEGGLLGGLALFGVPLESAIAITAVERAVSYGFSTVAGGLAVAVLGGRGLLRATMSAPRVAGRTGADL